MSHKSKRELAKLAESHSTLNIQYNKGTGELKIEPVNPALLQRFYHGPINKTADKYRGRTSRRRFNNIIKMVLQRALMDTIRRHWESLHGK